jgi:hypothetical protein
MQKSVHDSKFQRELNVLSKRAAKKSTVSTTLCVAQAANLTKGARCSYQPSPGCFESRSAYSRSVRLGKTPNGVGCMEGWTSFVEGVL